MSILEASIHGLPSLVNKNIETDGLEDSIIETNTSIESITNNLKKIGNWTIGERHSRGKNISKNVEKKTSIEKISIQYENLYYNISNESSVSQDTYSKIFSFLIPKNFRFLIITGTYMFNLMFSSFIVVALVALGHYSIAGELGLVTSFWITLTQIFSSNMRSIIISEQKIEFAAMTMIYRIIFSIILLVISYFIILNFFFI